LLHHSSPDNQPKFDMVESAGVGYKYLFDERSYLLKLIAAPFIIKFVTILILALFGENISFLSANLILLPSLFAEGWLLAQIIRSFTFNERWPMALSGETKLDQNKLLNRQNCIIAGILTYVLINIAFYVLQSILVLSPEDLETLTQISAGTPLAEGQTFSFLPIMTMIIMLFSMVFWFPLIWLYIAASANIYFKDFYLTIMKQRLSLRLIATWMICLIPFLVALAFIRNFIVTAFGMDLSALSSAESILLESITQFIGFLISIVSTVAIANGLSHYFNTNNQ
jgi:hypothetical protein